MTRFAEDFLLFQFPHGVAKENLNLNIATYKIISKKEVEVSETSGSKTIFSREVYEGESGRSNLVRTEVDHALWSTFEYGGKEGETFKVEIDPRKSGGYSG